MQESAEAENTLKNQIADFHRTLEENEVLDTFGRYVFESIVEKVIVGGYGEDGNADPYKLIFIYRTGFKSSLDGTNFKPPERIERQPGKAPVCVPIQPTRQKQRVPIIVTTHVESVVSLLPD